MWRRRERTAVTCIACGETVDRGDAREYDKHGNRWDRDEKTFEHLCKPCFRDLSNQSRLGLEALLTDVGAGDVSRSEFLQRYLDATEASDETEERERDQER